MKSNGKRFTIIFVGLTILIGIAFSFWLKQAYDMRPIVEMNPEKK